MPVSELAGDPARRVDDLGQGSLSSYRGQRGMTVVHGTGLLAGDGCLDTTHRGGQRPVHSSLISDYNVMTRNV